MSKNITIKLGPIKFNMTPFGFHKYACDYLQTADKWTDDNNYSPVPYFLYCRAIELGLKAFLLAKGKNLIWVKDSIGHDLIKGLNSARQNSLNEIHETTDTDENEINKANKYYKSKGFEYFSVLNHLRGVTGLPNLDIIRAYTHRLLYSIKPLTDNTDVD